MDLPRAVRDNPSKYVGGEEETQGKAKCTRCGKEDDPTYKMVLSHPVKMNDGKTVTEIVMCSVCRSLFDLIVLNPSQDSLKKDGYTESGA